MADPKPITITQITAASYQGGAEPQPFVIVGAGNVGQLALVTKQSGIANQPAATLPADFAGVQTQLQSLTTKINAILAALRSAGILAP